jgi:glyoxylase-like metal-dependent hydrolase (beta-lactamase superfamily II)
MRHLLIAAAILAVAPMLPAHAQPAPGSAQAVDVAPFVAREINARVHLLSTLDDYYGPAIGNVILIEQSDGFVVVDSGLNAANGRAVVRYARSLSPKPIKAVMITHWHNDHPQGISSIRDAFPKVRIIATRATEAGMLGPEAFDVGYAPGPKWDGAMAALLVKSRVQLQQLLDAADTPPDRKDRVRKALVQYAGFARDFPGTYIVPPTETFERELVIDDREVPVHILHLGRANTEGDALAWLPTQKIVATGDIVVSPIPFGFGSFSGDWIETIGKVKALGFATLIPGHGAPMSDSLYLDKLVAAMRDLRAQVIPLAKAGMPLDDVRKKVDFSKSIAAFATTERIKANAKALFFDPMTGSVYKEATGQPIVQGEGSPEPDVPRDTPPKPSSIHHDS